MSSPLPGQLELPLPGSSPVPYQAHSTTSREAAEWQSRTNAAANLEAWALGAFVAVHDTGPTDEELDRTARAAGLAFQTLRPRRVALWHKGLVHDLGERRQTASGRRATVWVVTAAGHREWEGCR